ncbi:mRNA-decapping enzyme 1B isoform X1 [Balaenoptera acutorostrata]|uniref:5'-(N(7)-methylguanosine 5'-triphospho)-[mRNA] hydrolase n=1 Tax=Balaenoptera acutorostrata TaxID=9767 RepID=A0ABM3UCG0_BALAC|nr:mRNA-decapping enzyme 1B isoform X1 [Balaenoptera acutorostrata]
MAAAAAGYPAGKGRDISLAALRRHDPYISRIVDVASQVALYTFGHRANEWEKTDVEGTLFVYTRSASPKHGFTIMNRLSMENRTEPITKDLDFQLQDPFLLYRNARLSIYGIWFYDKEECQRIAELMKNLAQYEQLKAHRGVVVGASPVSLSSGEGKEADILRMLSKAKDEYTKCKACPEPKQISSSSAIYDNPNLIKPIPVKPSGSRQQRGPRPGQTLDPEPQHLSLTALFGKQDKATCQEAAGPPKTLHQQQQEKLPIRQGVVRSLSYEEPRRRSPPVDRQLCPAIQKLLVGSADLQPLAELPESWPCRDAARPGSPRGPEVSRRAHGAPRTQNAPDQLQSIPKAPAPAASAATLPPQTPGPRALPRPAPPGPGPGRQPPGPSEVSPRELLWKLQAVQQEQQLPAPGRPALAAKFPAATPRARARNPLESWRDQTPSAEQQAPLLQAVLTSTECVPRPCCTWYVEMRSWVPCPCGRRSPWALEVLSPRRAPPAAGLSPLMSPLVFTQPPWAPPPERGSGLLPPGSQDPAATPSGPLLPLRTPEPPRTPGSALTKPQLQEALLHLVQNDDNFLNIIYEAYLFSMTQAAMKKTL